MNKPGVASPEIIHFVTFIVGGRKHLLTNESCVRIVLNSLAWLCETRQLILYGFVLLPSHTHLLCRPVRKSIQSLAESFADFTAQRMITALRRRGRGPLLHYLHAKTPGDHPGAPIWGEVKIQSVGDSADALRKLDYMHRKPAADEWRLAEEPCAYPYSSACFYGAGRQPVLPIEDVRLEFWSGTSG